MLSIFRKPETRPFINPRFRAYGKARIDIAKRANTREDWDHLWKKPTHSFPFSWGSSWKQCIEYKVADFPAEVGFFIDVLGFPVNAFDPDYAMFTSPSSDFYFSVVPARENESPTPRGAIRLQFMVQDIIETALELERRGVKFDQMPARVADNSSFLIGCFQTPNGIGIEMWGFDTRFNPYKSDQMPDFIERERESNYDKRVEGISSDFESDDDQLNFPLSEKPSKNNDPLDNIDRQTAAAEEIEYLASDEW
jgi:catechol 2,3-dioxygenase-like lactoylglutathione lyase family enzyme